MRIGIAGAAGRMGRMLVQAVLTTPGAELAGGSERPGHPAIGADLADGTGLPACGIAIVDSAARLFEGCDVVIDFTSPVALSEHIWLAAARGVALVVGTTGLTDVHQQSLAGAARRVPVVLSANFSIGVNLLLGLTQRVAAVLGPDFDIEIAEMHHRHKVDAPSGTALALGAAAAKGRGVQLADVAVKSRDGHTGARPEGAIGFATLRGGDVVGEHTVLFAGEGERIGLSHIASSRAVFAKGAVRAALWTDGKPPRLYSMADVLGLG